MRNILLVIKQEIANTLGKPSFWITTFLLPLVIMGFTVGSQLVVNRMFETEDDSALLNGAPQAQAITIGYVDQAGLIQEFPQGFPNQMLQKFESEAVAQTALERGELQRYYVIPMDYTVTGELLSVEPELKPFTRFGTTDLLSILLSYNLAIKAQTPALLLDPLPTINERMLAPQDDRELGGYDTFAGFIIPYAVLFIFFFVLTMTGGFMLQSVSREKENRVAEVLLLSLRPRELMLGKIVGLGLVALVQMGIWLGGSLFTLERNRALLDLAADAVILPPGFIGWAIAFFLLGFLVYAAMLGAIGALAPTAREGSQFTFIILLPLMLPLWFQSAFIQAPNGTMATFFSLFPLSAPMAMITRMVTTTVPLWQIVLSLALLAATAYGLVVLAARFFRADTLLSDATLDWKRLRGELLNRKARA
ncbi:MAG: ABC transporter permease [Anaerolineae bacterium]|jgi:ABC-2 type transport system permease protein|nr:ABC transporter permease [Anaerolineae bacterium]